MFAIMKVLSESVVGAFGDDAGGDEEEEEEGGAEKAPDGAFYEVIGTLSNTKSTPPTWAKEIVQVCDYTASPEYNQLYKIIYYLLF